MVDAYKKTNLAIVDVLSCISGEFICQWGRYGLKQNNTLNYFFGTHQSQNMCKFSSMVTFMCWILKQLQPEIVILTGILFGHISLLLCWYGVV